MGRRDVCGTRTEDIDADDLQMRRQECRRYGSGADVAVGEEPAPPNNAQMNTDASDGCWPILLYINIYVPTYKKP